MRNICKGVGYIVGDRRNINGTDAMWTELILCLSNQVNKYKIQIN